MARLYIANTTKQHHHFFYRLPEDSVPRGVMIKVGAQEQLPGDLSLENIERIIGQHERYGLKNWAGIKNAKDFVGLCYSIDKPILVDHILTAVEHNDDVLDTAADDRREVEAAAVAGSIQNSMREVGVNVARTEVTMQEDTGKSGKEPRVANGFEIGPNPEVTSKHNARKSRRAQ